MGQIVSHFSTKFDLSREIAASVLEEIATLTVSEIKKSGSFTIPGTREAGCLQTQGLDGT